MQLRFLLGPAGAGKTSLCLEEIRHALRKDPAGPPLILLAPKQATFQLERQLLESDLPGYTRLHILSFERLAKFLFDELRRPAPPLLSEEGRVMVFRALLARRAGRLRIFHSSAALAGFARQLSAELRELQQLGLAPEALGKLAARGNLSPSLRGKLHDLALLWRDYVDWLEEHKLQDGAALLRLAADALRASRPGGVESPLKISHLWLDGFAEMTPQELALLAEVARCCQRMTLAFCIDGERGEREDSWLSIWSGIKRARGRCAEVLQHVPGVEFRTVILKRNERRGRFAGNAALRYLEKHWERAGQAQESTLTLFPLVAIAAENAPASKEALRVAVCSSFHSEAVLAAGEILRFVREGNGARRFRDVAVLLRNLDGCDDELRRVFEQYGIPFFLDRREPVAHHPLAELTRNALRLAARGWRHEDWFGALKTGLVCTDQEAVDRLENAALELGWKGETWKRPFKNLPESSADAETLRASWTAPFLELTERLANGSRARASGPRLTEALRHLWANLKVEKTLEGWSKNDTTSTAGGSDSQAHLHGTVWRQMNGWLDDVDLAFGEEELPLAEWLSILEAGLGGMSVGVIPPALDQVLIGAVDRSRNPDLKLALLLGANETIFPAPAVQGRLLTEADRDQLLECDIPLGLSARQFLSGEHFLGYIACTRARERLVVTFSRQDAAGRALNPSLFISHLQRLFPDLPVEEFAGPAPEHPEHVSELIPMAAKVLASRAEAHPDWQALLALPSLSSFARNVPVFGAKPQSLPPPLAKQLYGEALRTSVSGLEQYAACSFKFFVHAGLRAEERKLFELAAREKGTFQHEMLAKFHEELQKEGLRWRDLTPASARARIAAVFDRVGPEFSHGLLLSDTRSRFAARMMMASLQDCVATMVEWMSQYNFDPRAVELGFGREDGGLPAWEVDLGGGHRLILRGRIDRVDLCPSRDDPDAALAVVVDYKSSSHKLDPVKLFNGLQLQLPAYLSVLQHLESAKKALGFSRLTPAGVFFVNLRGKFAEAETRQDVLDDPGAERRAAYKHLGRFDAGALADLDNRNAEQGTQFNFKKNKNGSLSKVQMDGVSTEDFRQLLSATEDHLRRIGAEVFAGNIEVNPHEKISHRRPCDMCQYQGVCRIDPWTHTFRVLQKAERGRS